MEPDTGTAQAPAVVDHSAGGEPSADDLVRVADELLEHVGELRREYEGLRETLAESDDAQAEPGAAHRHRRPVDDDEERGSANVRAMALQMALAGDSRETAKDYLSGFEVDGVDPIVDDVFDRTEAQRKHGRRRIFSRRAS